MVYSQEGDSAEEIVNDILTPMNKFLLRNDKIFIRMQLYIHICSKTFVFLYLTLIINI
jgi:hypothetical protein